MRLEETLSTIFLAEMTACQRGTSYQTLTECVILLQSSLIIQNRYAINAIIVSFPHNGASRSLVVSSFRVICFLKWLDIIKTSMQFTGAFARYKVTACKN